MLSREMDGGNLSFIAVWINIKTKLHLTMEFKKKYPCTQCIFLTTKESTLAKHMIRHQNVSEDEQVSKSSSPPSIAISAAVLGSSSLPKALESSISKETNLSVEKFKCKDCERIFKSKQALCYHTKSIH